MSNRLYLYPVWIRLWHWANALLFLILIATGASMHYAGAASVLIPFGAAVTLHNFAGVTLTVLYAVFAVGNIVTGNYKHYLPRLRGLIGRLLAQTRYYLFGIFTGAPHPTHATAEQKFNSLQQVTYLMIMYVLVPLLIATGWFLFFPEQYPEQFMGAGGLWPLAAGHTLLGYFGTLFMLGHAYLGTTGHTPTTNFKGMWNGWHESEDHPA